MKVCFPTRPDAPITQVFNNLNKRLYAGDGRHKGIDLGVAVGTPVYACMEGTVIAAEVSNRGYGRNVKISHPDGAVSIYGHLASMDVSVGVPVSAGQKIGTSGGDPGDKIDGDGNSTGMHLHWEIRPPGTTYSDQMAVDPMEYCLKYLPEAFRDAVTTAGIYVRILPDPRSKAIGSLFAKTQVKVVEVVEGWARLRSLRPGWVSARYLSINGQETNPPVQVPPVHTPSDKEKLEILWKWYQEKTDL